MFEKFGGGSRMDRLMNDEVCREAGIEKELESREE